MDSVVENSCAKKVRVCDRGHCVGATCTSACSKNPSVSHESQCITDELKEVVIRIHGECELRMADVLKIDQLDDAT